MSFGVIGQILDFMEAGGQVLWVILALTLALWSIIAERVLFLKSEFPKMKQSILDQWNGRQDKMSWEAHRIREQLISQLNRSLSNNLPLIKTLVALSPLLGLLGTVTGMVTVFDVMAAVGTGNPRSMASGISMATIPTMAGMVVSISGIYFKSWLEGRTKLELEKFADELVIQGVAS